MEDYQKISGSRSSACTRENVERFPVAMAYVPWQHWHTVYDLEKGLSSGTIFPELDKPFRGVRNMKGGCR